MDSYSTPVATITRNHHYLQGNFSSVCRFDAFPPLVSIESVTAPKSNIAPLYYIYDETQST